MVSINSNRGPVLPSCPNPLTLRAHHLENLGDAVTDSVISPCATCWFGVWQMTERETIHSLRWLCPSLAPSLSPVLTSFGCLKIMVLKTNLDESVLLGGGWVRSQRRSAVTQAPVTDSLPVSVRSV